MMPDKTLTDAVYKTLGDYHFELGKHAAEHRRAK